MGRQLNMRELAGLSLSKAAQAERKVRPSTANRSTFNGRRRPDLDNANAGTFKGFRGCPLRMECRQDGLFFVLFYPFERK